MEAGGNQWNLQVTPQERTMAIGKLRRFLNGVVGGESQEAAAKAAELAQKFEQHVYTSTSTKEEYMRVIIDRMQKVQQRHQQQVRPPPAAIATTPTSTVAMGLSASQLPELPIQKIRPPPLLSASSSLPHQNLPNKEPLSTIVPRGQPVVAPLSTPMASSAVATEAGSIDLSLEDKVILKEKLHRAMALIPRIEAATTYARSLQNDRTTEDNEGLARMLKGLLEKQSRIIHRDVYVFGPSSLTLVMLELRQLLKRFAPTTTTTMAASGSMENGIIEGQTSTFNSLERRLLAWMRSQGPTKAINERISHPRRMRLFHSNDILNHQTRRQIHYYIKSEINHLHLAYPDVRIIWRLRFWGYEFSINTMRPNIPELVIEFPQTYPSTDMFLHFHANDGGGGDGDGDGRKDNNRNDINDDDNPEVRRFIEGYEGNEIKFFPPFTISIVLGTFLYFLGNQSSSESIK